MKTLLQRFTRWHNRRTKRRGNLWEETLKSVIVEDSWAGRSSRKCRMLLLEEGAEKTMEVVTPQGERVAKVVRQGIG